jgi:hypothetical protein
MQAFSIPIGETQGECPTPTRQFRPDCRKMIKNIRKINMISESKKTLTR